MGEMDRKEEHRDKPLRSLHSPNSFGWEYKPRSSLRTHAFHRRDTKDPDIHVLDGWMPATKTHPARTIHEDGMWLPQWLDKKKTTTNKQKTKTTKTATYAKISPKMANPRDIAGECRRRRRRSSEITKQEVNPLHEDLVHHGQVDHKQDTD